MDESTHEAPTPVYLTAVIKGVVIPTWLAVCLAIVALFSTLTLALALFLVRDATQEAAEANRNLAKEMRILQVHVQDIENVLIRQRLARRDDFAPWPEGDSTIEIKPHDKEK